MTQTLHKVCIVLALVALAPLGLASVSGRTLAYLTASESATNTFTFAEPGDEYTDTVKYYLYYNNNSYIFNDPAQENRTYNAGSQISMAASNFATAPNGLQFSYVTVNGVRVNTNTYEQPSSDLDIRVYYEPISYTIEYDYDNGINNPKWININNGTLMNSYTVMDYIKLPYGKSYEKYEEDPYDYSYDLEGTYIFSITVTPHGNNAFDFLYWTDNNNVQHTFETDWTIIMGEKKDDWGEPTGEMYIDDWVCPGTNGASWCSNIAPVNGLRYADFANRQTGNLSLTLTWQRRN